MTAMTFSKPTIQALYRANLGILKQKLDLMHVMTDVFGHETARLRFAQVCDIVKASMGQHIRHSMDHIELAANMAISMTDNNTSTALAKREIHYDLRERGGLDESDMDRAEDRIRRVEQLLLEQVTKHQNERLVQPSEEVSAYFMLSGDGNEFQLPTTIRRELGFAAHHAIHHMAMIKIIVQETLRLPTDMMPLEFGKAPSTINYDNSFSQD
jgi:hypothetical protein